MIKDFSKYFIVGTNSNALHDTMNGMVVGELIRCRACKYYVNGLCGHIRAIVNPVSNGFCNFAEMETHDDSRP